MALGLTAGAIVGIRLLLWIAEHITWGSQPPNRTVLLKPTEFNQRLAGLFILILLTGVLFPLSIIGIDPHNEDPAQDKPYFAWMLLLEAGVMGSFMSLYGIEESRVLLRRVLAGEDLAAETGAAAE